MTNHKTIVGRLLKTASWKHIGLKIVVEDTNYHQHQNCKRMEQNKTKLKR